MNDDSTRCDDASCAHPQHSNTSDDADAELEQLRAERDAARAELAALTDTYNRLRDEWMKEMGDARMTQVDLRKVRAENASLESEMRELEADRAALYARGWTDARDAAAKVALDEATRLDERSKLFASTKRVQHEYQADAALEIAERIRALQPPAAEPSALPTEPNTGPPVSGNWLAPERSTGTAAPAERCPTCGGIRGPWISLTKDDVQCEDSFHDGQWPWRADAEKAARAQAAREHPAAGISAGYPATGIAAARERPRDRKGWQAEAVADIQRQYAPAERCPTCDCVAYRDRCPDPFHAPATREPPREHAATGGEPPKVPASPSRLELLADLQERAKAKCDCPAKDNPAVFHSEGCAGTRWLVMQIQVIPDAPRTRDRVGPATRGVLGVHYESEDRRLPKYPDWLLQEVERERDELRRRVAELEQENGRLEAQLGAAARREWKDGDPVWRVGGSPKVDRRTLYKRGELAGMMLDGDDAEAAVHALNNAISGVPLTEAMRSKLAESEKRAADAEQRAEVADMLHKSAAAQRPKDWDDTVVRLQEEAAEARAALLDAHRRRDNKLAEAEKRAEKAETDLRLFVEKSALICTYCGTPVERDEVPAHTKGCSKHPMAVVIRDLAAAEAALRELQEITRDWFPLDGATEHYERMGERFRRDTGLTPPGKDVPAAMGADQDIEKRMAAWNAWRTATSDRLRDRARAALSTPPADALRAVCLRVAERVKDECVTAIGDCVNPMAKDDLKPERLAVLSEAQASVQALPSADLWDLVDEVLGAPGKTEEPSDG